MTYSLHITYNDTLVAYKPLDSYSLLRQILGHHRSVLINEHGAAVSDIQAAGFDADGEKIDGTKIVAPSAVPPALSHTKMQLIEHAITLQLDDSFYGTIVMQGLS